jgi:hypothetical protein
MLRVRFVELRKKVILTWLEYCISNVHVLRTWVSRIACKQIGSCFPCTIFKGWNKFCVEGDLCIITIFCHFKLFTQDKRAQYWGSDKLPSWRSPKVFGLFHSKAKSRFPSTNLRFSWVKNIASKRRHSRRCQSAFFFWCAKFLRNVKFKKKKHAGNTLSKYSNFSGKK